MTRRRPGRPRLTRRRIRLIRIDHPELHGRALRAKAKEVS